MACQLSCPDPSRWLQAAIGAMQTLAVYVLLLPGPLALQQAAYS
jgi:hypothetical protein